MDTINVEKNNLMFNVNGETPSVPFIEIKVDCNHDEFLMMLKEVVGVIADVRSNEWPSDEYFEASLPRWFVDNTLKNDLNYINSNPNLYLWHFGSWIDGMRNRNWIWFSSLKIEKGFIIKIETFDFPYLIEPLEYVVRCTGCVMEYTITEHLSESSVSQRWFYENSKWVYR